MQLNLSYWASLTTSEIGCSPLSNWWFSFHLVLCVPSTLLNGGSASKRISQFSENFCSYSSFQDHTWCLRQFSLKYPQYDPWLHQLRAKHYQSVHDLHQFGDFACWNMTVAVPEHLETVCGLIQSNSKVLLAVKSNFKNEGRVYFSNFLYFVTLFKINSKPKKVQNIGQYFL